VHRTYMDPKGLIPRFLSLLASIAIPARIPAVMMARSQLHSSAAVHNCKHRTSGISTELLSVSTVIYAETRQAWEKGTMHRQTWILTLPPTSSDTCPS